MTNQTKNKMRAEFEVLRPDFESLPMFDIDRTLLQKDAEGDYVYEPVQGMWIGYGLAHAYPSAQSQQDALDARLYRHLREYASMSYPSGEGSSSKDAYLVVTGYGNVADPSIIDEAVKYEIAAQGASNV